MKININFGISLSSYKLLKPFFSSMLCPSSLEWSRSEVSILSTEFALLSLELSTAKAVVLKSDCSVVTPALVEVVVPVIVVSGCG